MRPRTLALAVALGLSIAPPAWAVREWYDYYLRARDEQIPKARWSDCIRSLREALRLRPEPGVNVRTYGMELIDYLPHYHLGVCYLGSEDYPAAIAAFARSEEREAVKKPALRGELVRLRAQAQSGEAARAGRRARAEVERLRREARELERKRSWNEALARLADAEQLAKALDPPTLRSVTDEQERVRAVQREALDAADRAQRIEQRLGEGDHLLEEGRLREAVLAFDEVLGLDPRNARAREGQRIAQDRILASTTRAAREKAFADGKALFDAGRHEEALIPLTDAAADPGFVQARDLLARARQIVEGLRRQRALRAEIERLWAQGQAAFSSDRFPEAQVAFEAVLRLDPGNARARERLNEAERRTGEALIARWLPNQEPTLALFEPQAPVVEGATFGLQGFATDDRGIQKVEVRVGDKVVAEIAPRADAVNARSLPFGLGVPLVPGLNTIHVSAVDSGGLTRTLTLPIERRLRFYETRYFLPSAAASALGLIGVGLVAQRVRRRHAARRRFNPYIAGAPVLDEQMFFGREKLTQRMLGMLHRNSLMITGERRIGKTTFLHHLKKVLEADDGSEYRFFPVFVDLQGVPEQAFFHAVMAEVVDALDLGETTRAELRFRPQPEGYDARSFSHDLQRVIAELQTRTDKKAKLALLIDEVDVLNEYSESVNQRLRGIFMKSFSDRLVAVMSGVGIRRRWKSEVSPWYNFFDEIDLPPFTRQEAEALIREPVAGVFRFQPEAVERILELSRLRPYLIQKYCVHAVSHMLESRRFVIRLEDAEAARAVVELEAHARAQAAPRAGAAVAD